MYCHICGKELPVQAQACPDCGMPVPSKRENRSRKIAPPSNTVAKPITAKPVTTKVPPTPSPSDYSMKWYYYLRYAHLINAAIGLILTGIIYMTNEEIFMGIIAVATGIYALVVRSSLANFRTSAPAQLFVFFGLQYGSDAIYSLYQCYNGYSYESSTYITVFVIDMIALGILLSTNLVYFVKRKELFTY